MRRIALLITVGGVALAAAACGSTEPTKGAAPPADAYKSGMFNRSGGGNPKEPKDGDNKDAKEGEKKEGETKKDGEK